MLEFHEILICDYYYDCYLDYTNATCWIQVYNVFL